MGDMKQRIYLYCLIEKLIKKRRETVSC